MPKPRDIIGAAFAVERRKIRVSQAELATRLKRSQTWVARFELGKRSLTIEEIKLVSRVIGCNPVPAVLAALGKSAGRRSAE